MIAWMLYTSLAGVLIALAATAVDRSARLAQRATRWVWVGGMTATVALVFVAPYRSEKAATPVVVAAARDGRAPTTSEPATTRETVFRAAQRVFAAPLVAGIAAVNRRLPSTASAFAFGAWAVATAGLALVFMLVQVHFGRARRRWPLADIHGARVRVAPSTGPVVIGLLRPEIIVPRWMLDREPADQRVVIAHEREHVRARDTLLLTGGWIVAVLMPWNAALWFMLSRLRLAIELDCDARVLRGGVTPMAYGGLLIDLAERAVPFRLAATALSDDSSHLHQRILAMKPQVPRFAFARASVAATFGIVSLVAACATALPTDADIQKMDVASAEKSARDLSLITGSTVYTVDGAPATEAAAKAIPPSRLATVNVVRATDGTPSQIAITTKTPDGKAATVTVSGRGRGRIGGPGDSTGLFTKLTSAAESSPLLLIDGVRSEKSALSKLNKESIESVEILKGTAAAAEYGPDAEHGVIVVKTKSGAKKGQ